MPNKYYIPRERVRSPYADIPNQLLRLNELRQTKQLEQGRQDIAKQRLALEGRQAEAEYGKPGTTGQGLAARRVTTAERLADLKAQEVEGKRDVPDQDFNRGVYAPMKAMFKTRGLDKAFAPVFDAMDSIADNPEFTKRTTYHHFKNNWPAYRKALLGTLSKEYEKATEENPAKAVEILSYINRIEQDETGEIIDQAMPGTSQAIQNEQAAILSKQKVIPYGQSKEGVEATLRGREKVAKIGATSRIQAAKISAGGKESQEDKELKGLKSSFEKAIGRANAAKRGENIVSEAVGSKGPEVATQEYQRAINLAIQYAKKGGNPKDLGIETVEKDNMTFMKTGENQWTRIK